MARPEFRLDFTPPPREEMHRYLALSRWYFRPQTFGLENVDPAVPTLFVGNHTLFGVIDSPLISESLYWHTGVFPRSLGDHFHFDIPIHRSILTHYGVVDGTPENCHALMQDKQHIMVFPGGGREVMKRKDEINRTVWKARTGFARMALEHGYRIIPFASLGADETYRISWDANDLEQSLLGDALTATGLMERLYRGGDLFAPRAHGVGPYGLLPRRERFYFRFGKPIDTAEWNGKTDTLTQMDVRRQTEEAINMMMFDMMDLREQEKRQRGWRGVINKLVG